MNKPDFSRIILHVDANNFYASCECARNPALVGQPLVVCGNPQKRKGIVLAKSYEAKRYGIKTGDTVYSAEKKCPNLILLQPDFSIYSFYSKALFAIYTRFTDRVECFGMDECWLDVTGSTRLFGDGKQIADTIRQIVKDELHLTVSVGVSFSKVFAKLGSDYKKPDATTVIDRDNYRSLAWGLPVEDMIMVGRQTQKTLRNIGILTIGDLANAPESILHDKLGINGVKLIHAAQGLEEGEVLHYYDHVIPESISNGTTTSVDIERPEEALSLTTTLADMVMTRLRGYGLRAMGCFVYCRANDFVGWGGTMKLESPIGSASELIDNCTQMLTSLWREHNMVPLRSVTLGVSRLIGDGEAVQTSLFDTVDHQRNTSADMAVDRIRAKFGKNVISRAASLTYTYTTDEILDDSTYKPFKKN